MTALENVMVGRHVRTRSNALGAVFRTPALPPRGSADPRQRACELLQDTSASAQYAD